MTEEDLDRLSEMLPGLPRCALRAGLKIPKNVRKVAEQVKVEVEVLAPGMSGFQTMPAEQVIWKMLLFIACHDLELVECEERHEMERSMIADLEQAAAELGLECLMEAACKAIREQMN